MLSNRSPVTKRGEINCWMKQICVNGKAKVSNKVCLAPTVWFSSSFECSVFPVLLVLTFRFNIVPPSDLLVRTARTRGADLLRSCFSPALPLMLLTLGFPLPKLLPHKLMCTRIRDQRRTLSLMKWLKIKGHTPLPSLGAASLYVPAPFTSGLLGPPLALGSRAPIHCMWSSPLDSENHPALLSRPLRLRCHISPPPTLHL